MKIEELRVYDPVKDGLTFKKYNEIRDEIVRRCSENAAHIFEEGVYDAVSNSRVTTRGTLKDFLYGPCGYFESNPRVGRVVFTHGMLLGAYEHNSATPNLDKLAKEQDTLLFAFSAPVDTD